MEVGEEGLLKVSACLTLVERYNSNHFIMVY